MINLVVQISRCVLVDDEEMCEDHDNELCDEDELYDDNNDGLSDDNEVCVDDELCDVWSESANVSHTKL